MNIVKNLAQKSEKKTGKKSSEKVSSKILLDSRNTFSTNLSNFVPFLEKLRFKVWRKFKKNKSSRKKTVASNVSSLHVKCMLRRTIRMFWVESLVFLLSKNLGVFEHKTRKKQFPHMSRVDTSNAVLTMVPICSAKIRKSLFRVQKYFKKKYFFGS